MIESISNLCSDLNLKPLYSAVLEQQKSGDYDDSSFLERLHDLLTAQANHKHEAKVTRLKKAAKLRCPSASMADLPYTYWNEINKTDIERLLSLDWVRDAHNVVFVGPTGSSKTTTANALANHAILNEIPVLNFRFVELLLKLSEAEKKEELGKFRQKLNKIPIIIIDDWAIKKLTDAQRHLLFEFIEGRDGKASLIITSQYAPEQWHSAFGDPTVADSVLDRIVNQSYIYNTKTDVSLRQVYGVNGGKHEN